MPISARLVERPCEECLENLAKDCLAEGLPDPRELPLTGKIMIPDSWEDRWCPHSDYLYMVAIPAFGV
jgi:hypothetical protein